MEIPVYLVLAVGLLVGGVIGSIAPMVPAGLLSIAGILVYWWHTGYTSPGPILLAAFLLVGGLVLLADWAGGAVAAKAGGASARNSVIGAVVGAGLFFVLGPLGIIVGLVGTVFALELRQGRETRESARAALFALVGALSSGAVQFVLTLGLLVAFLGLVVV